MDSPNFDAAKEFALLRLTNDLPPYLCYHNLSHTRDEVMPAVEQFASIEGIDEESLLLLRTAALYHDIGFVETYEQHELAGDKIAKEVLPGYGYTSQQVDSISGIILATCLPQSPTSLLGELLADADLAILGNLDFWKRSQLLRCELSEYGEQKSELDWLQEQLVFLQEHTYFTEAAKTLKNPGKINNIESLQTMINSTIAVKE